MDQKTINASAELRFSWLRLVLDLILLWSFLSAVSIPLRLDNWPPLVFLCYPPRIPYILFAVGLAIYLLLNRIFRGRIKRGYWTRLGMSLATIVCCIHSLGWNPLRTNPAPFTESPKADLSLVTANTSGRPVEFVAQLKKISHPNIICFQEVSLSHRKAIAASFPNHQFFYGSDDIFHKKHSGDLVFTNATGLDRSTFITEQAFVDANVTGYRTFAVIAPLRATPTKSLAIVNVHTTKALAFHAGLQGFVFQTPGKSQRHVEERIAIETWVNEQPNDIAVLLAGDFNAPTRTVGVRIPGFNNAHLIASPDSLLTYPETWPVLGIDHVLGNDRIRFTKSEVHRNSSSDHRYRRVEFSCPG